ncbi:MAG: hypothetical protein ACFB9M_07110 [Myxococcota bacterium]
MSVVAALALVATSHAAHQQFRLDQSVVRADVSIFSDELILGGVFGPTAVQVTATHPRLFARLAWSPRFAVEAELPIAVASFDDTGTSRVGNLSFAFLGRTNLNPETLAEVGLGVAVPTATADTLVDPFALQVATLMDGFDPRYRWALETVSVFVPIRFEFASDDPLYFLLEGLPVVGFPTQSGRDVSAALTARAAGGVRARPVDFAVGFGASLLLGDDFNAEGQLYVEPRVEVALPVGRHEAFVDASLRIHIDEPAGFSFDDGGVYRVKAGGGMRFDLIR